MELTWQLLLDEGTQKLRKANVPEAGLDAKYLLFEAFHTDMAHFLLDRGRSLSHEASVREAVAKYRDMIEKRAARIPLQHITGSCEFMGLEFCVNEYVLIPRQDTETLVEQVLKDYEGKDPEILDMCTGSGCIGFSLGVLGKFGHITAADVSQKALRVALKNGRRLYSQNFRGKLVSVLLAEEPWRLKYTCSFCKEYGFTLVQSDLFSSFGEKEKFDVIVSNPPYIPTKVIEGLEPEVRDHDPMLALDGKEDGLYFYKRLAEECRDYLKPGGSVYFEIGHDQAGAVGQLLAQAGFAEIRVIKDAPGQDRVVRASAPFGERQEIRDV